MPGSLSVHTAAKAKAGLKIALSMLVEPLLPQAWRKEQVASS